MSDNEITARLEYLRGEIRAERISYGELAELQGLAPHIEPGDTELLEWAGVPEFPPPTLAEALAGVDRAKADGGFAPDGTTRTHLVRVLWQLDYAVREYLASPPVIACKCCVDNECECGGHQVGPVTRTGEVEVTQTAVHRCSNECEHAIRAVDNRNQSWTGGRPS